MTDIEKIIQCRLGLKVERCHNIRHHGSYSVAAHTTGMLLLAWHLYRPEFAYLAPVIMAHDIPEGWLGDIPLPTMHFTPGLKGAMKWGENRILRDLGLHSADSLSTEMQAMVHAVDRLEFYMWALEQRAMGNRYVDEAIKYMDTRLTSDALPGEAFKFFIRLKTWDVVPKQDKVVEEAMAL